MRITLSFNIAEVRGRLTLFMHCRNTGDAFTGRPH